MVSCPPDDSIFNHVWLIEVLLPPGPARLLAAGVDHGQQGRWMGQAGPRDPEAVPGRPEGAADPQLVLWQGRGGGRQGRGDKVVAFFTCSFFLLKGATPLLHSPVIGVLFFLNIFERYFFKDHLCLSYCQ